MSGVNKVILVGRLGKDPELKYLPNGNAACKFSVATSESWTDKGGQKQEKTEWHNIVVWSKLAEIANQYLQKGSQVYLEGKIQTDSWEDSSGNKRYSTSVIASSLQFLGGKTEGKPANKAPTASSAFPDESRTFVSEDIPF